MMGTIEEFNFRKEIFAATHKLIEEHNAGDHSYTLGHNRMSDWTETEYSKVLGYRNDLKTLNHVETPEPALLEDLESIPTAIDWRDHKAVTPVKDQGSCGSCWAFSTTGCLEGAHAIKSGHLISFSEQQLVDCDPRNAGCDGGLQEDAFKYLQRHYIYQESDYSYKGRDARCKYDDTAAKNSSGVKVDTWKAITPNNVAQMKKAASVQPLAVSIDAAGRQLMNYSGGIYDGTNLVIRLDHAVLVVGYGVENGTEFWIMKNSWASDWGEDGYMRVKIQDGPGIIGIQKEPLSATTTI
jgi:cathepsin L